ncbi:MAG: hypothetical protein A3J93_04410 [Candidatus Magasanikbacteria bacterium RIFOXYC2_FULL_42_28]|uniref:Uncharacterized protein n=1 Tax=Candidatus Magasanikbacteria bacterium RIFOXYC2_FULL_42_28 TaxID=1798704 RepID=A0A1F6NX77_9BACT|nr:MAG: hypothetical protein A3J93_04410 [Candidatus Magasanikbacteria bacterium RIFOXYC2_FULL_42_28]
MHILRKYQLDIVFLFFALTILLWAFFYALEYFGVDPRDYEWYVAGPLLIFYGVFIWQIRGKISIADRRALTTKSMLYWITLGVIMFLTFDTPVSAIDFWSVRVFFIIFTLLLADSYWDFKKISIRCLAREKNKC